MTALQAIRNDKGGQPSAFHNGREAQWPKLRTTPKARNSLLGQRLNQKQPVRLVATNQLNWI
ncbi:hypothetical protein SynNOUM97013_01089 [Synechococcus sp. NOUM97013]|nr:hypothetical protein SynNOUM97013_01089 [Synechococcus sp. NOUM97013]